MTKFVVLMFVCLLTFTGCSKIGGALENHWESAELLKDGRTVVCLHFKLANAGGMSCDWDNAKEKRDD